MTKINCLFSFVFTATIFITSCNSSSSENKHSSKTISIKPKSTQINGDLGDYFEVVDKEYKIPVSENSFDQQISVEVKRKDKDLPFNVDKTNPFGTNGGEEYHAGFGIELLGENGAIQVNNATDGGLGGPYSSDDVTSLLKLKKGETGFIRWTVNKTEGLNSFQLTSALTKEDQSSLTSDASKDETATASTGSENWDKMLDDYEKYVDDYIVFYKKAMKGDQSAMSEYPSLLEKATKLSESMQKAQTDNQLSATQISRLTKIQTKMIESASQK